MSKSDEHDDAKNVMKKRKQVIREGLARGERALAAGEVLSHQEAKDKMSKWLK